MSKNVSLDWHKNVAMNGQNLSFNLLQKQKKLKLCVVNWTQAISFRRVFNRSSICMLGKLRNLYTISKRKNLPATTNIEASGANLGHNLASGLNPHLWKFYCRTFNRLVKIARICRAHSEATKGTIVEPV